MPKTESATNGNEGGVVGTWTNGVIRTRGLHIALEVAVAGWV